MAITFLSTPEDVTPGTASSWENVNSSNVPATATGVILRVTHFNSVTAYGFGARKNGSADTRQEDLLAGGSGALTGMFFFIGVDSTNQDFEVWLENITVLKCELMGYFEDEAFFKTNGVDVVPGSAGSYVDVDITAQAEGGDDPTGAILAIQDTSGAPNSIGIRENSSADDFYDDHHHHIGYIVGLDSGDVFECKIEATSEDHVWLVGYFTKDLTWRTNATSLTLSTSWSDRTFDASAIAGMIAAPLWGNRAFGMRKNGSIEDILFDAKDYCIYIAACDGSGIAEHKTESTSGGAAWDVGYFTSTGGATTVTKTTTLDALLQKQGVLKTTTLDALLQKQGITKTASLDALLQAVLTKTTTLDAFLQIFNATKTTTLDALLQSLGLTKTTTLDALITNHVTLDVTLDALLQKLGDTKLTTLDALVERLGIIKTVTLDSQIQRENVARAVVLDALLQALGAAKVVTLDGVLQKLNDTKTLTLDAILVTAAPTSFPIYIPPFRRRRR